MNRIEASAETLMKQASMTSSEYFRKAIEDIDSIFGEGYAKSNSALDFLAASITSGLQDISESLYRLSDISTAIENLEK